MLKGLIKKKEKKEKKSKEPIADLPQAQPSGGDDVGADPDNNQADRKKLWSKASGLIGKDTMSLMSLPISLFEPLSVLQSMCEPLKFTPMLDTLVTMDDPIDRLCMLASFCLALFGSYNRTVKPFNPLLGETFEFVSPTNNFKCLCEQVSHHPPIGVAHTEAKDWALQQESKIETKFWGNTVDVFSTGANKFLIHSRKEEFTWTNPQTIIHNIIFGRIWVEPNGQFTLKNATTGDTCTIHYKKAGWFDGVNHHIEGQVKDKSGHVRAILSGKYNTAISATKVDANGRKGEPVVFWKKEHEEIKNRWKWPAFLFQLTATDDAYDRILPHSDSRLRSDVRALMSENMKLAGREKTRIEEAERVKRKERDAQAAKWAPLYFKKVGADKDATWEYDGAQYWIDREARIKKALESPGDVTPRVMSPPSDASYPSGEEDTDSDDDDELETA